ncbi:homocysteine S-methyltransferase family protein [Roseiconus lacunae]|uniref:homocysteine S-methyltransferase family protein n=1 Tax=Roseiconus lacunae TaxID=2605694 RepID=UPI001E4C6270|nr:homocysteine S-methyltransferase family protein [Roseiconus lacunae]MCD0463258.1 homocysteine S-methyltransferase family protein [Roseiconus lacunae]
MIEQPSITILDGPMGTELDRRGIDLPPPLWSASAIASAPQAIESIHRDYASAGASVHTAATFRTQSRSSGADWQRLTRQAIAITRRSVPSHHRVAGSLAPLEDCYRPDLSPANVSHARSSCLSEHRAMADCLAEFGCDLILCETFSHGGEAIIAVKAAVGTSVPTWLALTAGYDGSLMTPGEMSEIAKRVEQFGVDAILVNCTPATQTLRFVAALANANLSVPIGAYANAGHRDEGIGWEESDNANQEDSESVKQYVQLARQWCDAGATILGGCCGTGPAHIRGVSRMLEGDSDDSGEYGSGP